MTTSDFILYEISVKLAAYKAHLKVFIPTALWNLQLIIMWLYHLKRKIRLEIQTPFITNLSVSIIKILGKHKKLHHTSMIICHWNRPAVTWFFLPKWPYLWSAWFCIQLYFLALIMRMQRRVLNKIQLIDI